MCRTCCSGAVRSAGLDDRCRRGLDQSRDDDNARVQCNRRRKLRQRTQPPMRQPRRARRERVKMKHDQRSRKSDAEGAWPGFKQPVAIYRRAAPFSR